MPEHRSRQPGIKHIALVAHDNKKQELISWVLRHSDQPKGCEFFATGTTGKLIEEETQLTVHPFRSGPLGGDQQIGARIAKGD